jgi:hypothetical protein
MDLTSTSRGAALWNIISRLGAYHGHGLHAFGTSIAGLAYNRNGYGTDSLQIT